MNILIISLVFPPDGVSTAQIMGDLGEDLSGRGHNVSVFTTTPHFNFDPDAEARQPRRRFWGRLLQRSDFRGLHVYHALMPRKGKNVVSRIAGWGWFHAVSTLAALVLAPKPDVILVPSPPLTVALSAWLVGLLRRAPYVYNVQEIYPDIAINLGALRQPAVIALLRMIERFAYRKAAAVTVIAPRMRDRLIERGVPAEKVNVIPNCVNLEVLREFPKDNAFSREFRVHDKFVVSYAGNIGPAQGLEVVLDAAALLRDEPDIRFMLVGDGILVDLFRRSQQERRLDNVLIVPYQPFSRVPEIYGASDICLVPQALQTGADAIPSKVYRIMGCNRPVIAMTEPGADLADLVQDARCGLVIPPDSSRLAKVVLAAACDRLTWRRLGAAGREYVFTSYSRTAISNQYHQLLSLVADVQAGRA